MTKKTGPKTAALDGAYGLAAALAILLLASAARILGARNDLWLDEILALNMAHRLSSLGGIFTTLHSEINHHLYTAYLHLIGPAHGALAFRIPSLLSGIGAVAMAGLIGRRRNRNTSLLAMLLTGFSYALVLYSSEARGYSAAVFFSFLSFYLLVSYLEKRRSRDGLLFSLSVILGLSSQLVFLNFYLAALVWSGYRLGRPRSGRKQAWKAMAPLHALPLLFLAVFYLVDIRLITGVAGATSPSLIHSYGTALAWGLGTPSADAMQFLACALALAAFTAGLRQLKREGSDAHIFFFCVILAFPILLIVARGQRYIYARYFILSMAFLLILLSPVLDSILSRGGRGRVLGAVALLAYLLSNGWHVGDLLTHGRGEYREAIRFMAANSHQSPVTVGSEQDYRNGTIVGFYTAGAEKDRVIYCPQGAWPPKGPEWIIVEKESFEPTTPDWLVSTDLTGNEYEFKKVFPTAPLSGLHWLLYHNRGK